MANQGLRARHRFLIVKLRGFITCNGILQASIHTVVWKQVSQWEFCNSVLFL